MKKIYLSLGFAIFLVLLGILFYKNNSESQKETWRLVVISPLDKSQFITIFTLDNERFILNGKHDKLPKEGYLKLDISKVDALGDAISVCWNDSIYKWKLQSTYAKLIENNLDTTKFLYYQSIGKYGEPSSYGYEDSNCGAVLIREHLKPRGNLILGNVSDQVIAK